MGIPIQMLLNNFGIIIIQNMFSTFLIRLIFSDFAYIAKYWNYDHIKLMTGNNT